MRDHKSLLAWQRAHSVVRLVRHACRRYWRPHAAAVFAQLDRSALSVQLNISEGYALKSMRRFHNHLVIAYGSAIETIDLLELTLEDRLIPEPMARQGLGWAIEMRGLLLGLLRRYRRLS